VHSIPPEDQEETAWHEAGHAVAAVALGGRADEILTAATRETARRYRTAGWFTGSLGTGDVRRAAQSLAGDAVLVARAKMLGLEEVRVFEEGRGDTDVDKVLRTSGKIEADGMDARQFLEKAIATAAEVVAANWGVIARVAKALMDEPVGEDGFRSLSGEKLRRELVGVVLHEEGREKVVLFHHVAARR
jgi:hypothetical protein